MSAKRGSVRFLSDTDLTGRVPVYVIWELTLACNLKCKHCGSRAGSRRDGELNTSECFDLIDQIVDLGSREVVFIGGEAFLRKDWMDIIEYAAKKGLKCGLQTGGKGLSLNMLQNAQRRGLTNVGFSIDGLRDVHDTIRGVKGSFDAAIYGLTYCRDLGLQSSVNTQIHSGSAAQLSELYNVIRTLGVSSWQVQLTVAMGNAVDNSEVLIQPYDLLQIMPILSKLYLEGSEGRGPRLIAGNNIGYFGPYEHLWRGPDLQDEAYSGCSAGINVLGIEADGTVKGCPSLATNRFSEGNVRYKALQEIWQDPTGFQLNRDPSKIKLSGYCAECYYGPVCRGGCVWTSDSLLGTPGDNPYCHHRAVELNKKGVRERVERVEEASKESFGTGRYVVITEALVGK